MKTFKTTKRPPSYAPCPHCGFTPLAREADHRRVKSETFTIARRVYAECRECGGGILWTEEIYVVKPGEQEAAKS